MPNRFLPSLLQQKEGRDVFGSLQHELERVFDDFNRSWPAFYGLPKQGVAMHVDVSETDSAIEVKADIPGVDAKDIDVQIKDNVLTIKGEKKEEKEETKKDYHLTERRYGSFFRSFTLPAEVDDGKVEAKFSNGTLSITLPKSQSAESSSKKIDIKAA